MQLNVSEETVHLLIRAFEDKARDQVIDLEIAHGDVEYWKSQFEMESRGRDADYQEHREHTNRLEDENRVLRLELQRVEAQSLLGAFDFSCLNGLDFIPAIKDLRERTGLGLKQAKEAVENAVRDGKVTLKDGFIPQALRDVETPS